MIGCVWSRLVTLQTPERLLLEKICPRYFPRPPRQVVLEGARNFSAARPPESPSPVFEGASATYGDRNLTVRGGLLGPRFRGRRQRAGRLGPRFRGRPADFRSAGGSSIPAGRFRKSGNSDIDFLAPFRRGCNFSAARFPASPPPPPPSPVFEGASAGEGARNLADRAGRPGSRFRSAGRSATVAGHLRGSGKSDFESSATSSTEGLRLLGGAFLGVGIACSPGGFGQIRGPELDCRGDPTRAQVPGATSSPVGRFPAGRRICDSCGASPKILTSRRPRRFVSRGPATCRRRVLRRRRGLFSGGVGRIRGSKCDGSGGPARAQISGAAR